MINELLIFGIGFIKVAARSFQQKNVVNDKWVSIIPNSYIMGIMEVFTAGVAVLETTQSGFIGLISLGLAYGTGGWMGCWVGMWAYNKLHNN